MKRQISGKNDENIIVNEERQLVKGDIKRKFEGKENMARQFSMKGEIKKVLLIVSFKEDRKISQCK